MKKLLVLLILVMSAALLFLSGCKVLGYTAAADKDAEDYAASSADFAFTADGQVAKDIVLKEETDTDTGEYVQITLAADGTFTFEVWMRETISEGQKLALYDADDDGTVETGAEQDAFLDAEDLNEDGVIEDGLILMGTDDGTEDTMSDATPAEIQSYKGTWSYDSDTNRITFTITGYYGHLIETDDDQFDVAWAWHTIDWAPSENDDIWDGEQKSLTFTVFFDPIAEEFTTAAIGEDSASTVYSTYWKRTTAGNNTNDDADSSETRMASVTIDEDAKTVTTSVTVTTVNGVGQGGDVTTTTSYRGFDEVSRAWTINSGPAYASDNSTDVYTDMRVYGYDYKETVSASLGTYNYVINDVISMARYELEDQGNDVFGMKAVTSSVVSYPELATDRNSGDDEILDISNTLIDTVGRDGDFGIDVLEDTGDLDVLDLQDTFDEDAVTDLQTYLGW